MGKKKPRPVLAHRTRHLRNIYQNVLRIVYHTRRGKVRQMTIKEIQAADRPYLTPDDVAGVLECDPHAIRLAARDNPEQLGFPVMRVGRRTKIPRIPFLRFMGYMEETT
jgi:hypothetical protein